MCTKNLLSKHKLNWELRQFQNESENKNRIEKKRENHNL